MVVKLNRRDFDNIRSRLTKTAKVVPTPLPHVSDDRVSTMEGNALPKRGRSRRTCQGRQSLSSSPDPGEGPGWRLYLDLAIAPQPKQRARTGVSSDALLRAFRTAHGHEGRFLSALKASRHVFSQTPEATREFERAIAEAGRAAMTAGGLAPLAVPVVMEAIFTFSAGHKPEHEHHEGQSTTLMPTSQRDGDLDNHEKAVLDALNTIAYVDDRLVVSKRAVKCIGLVDRIQVLVRPALPDDIDITFAPDVHSR